MLLRSYVHLKYKAEQFSFACLKIGKPDNTAYSPRYTKKYPWAGTIMVQAYFYSKKFIKYETKRSAHSKDEHSVVSQP